MLGLFQLVITIMADKRIDESIEVPSLIDLENFIFLNSYGSVHQLRMVFCLIAFKQFFESIQHILALSPKLAVEGILFHREPSQQ